MSRVNKRLVNKPRILREDDVRDSLANTSRNTPPSAIQIKYVNEKVEECLAYIASDPTAGFLKYYDTTVLPGVTSEITVSKIPTGSRIIEVIVRCLATVTSGTMQVFHNAAIPVAMTNAMACATENAVVRAASLTDPTVTADGLAITAGTVAETCEIVIVYI